MRTRSNGKMWPAIAVALSAAAAYLLVCPVIAEGPGAAAAGEETQEFNNDSKIDRLTNDETWSLLTVIEALEKRGRFDDSLRFYQRVFDTAGEEIFGPVEGSEHTYVEARKYCLDRLSAGERQKARYRSAYDGDALDLLRHAIEKGDRKSLLEVVRRFLMTSSGPEALRALGWQAFEAEEYGEAVRYWSMMLKYHPSEADAVVTAGLAAAYAATGSAEGLETTARMAERNFPGATILAGGREIGLLRFIVEKMSSSGSGAAAADVWPTPGGPQRPVAESAPALKKRLWSHEMPFLLDGAQRFTAVCGDVVYVNTGDGVIALSLWDGALLWTHRAAKTARDLAEPAFARQAAAPLFGGVPRQRDPAWKWNSLMRPAGVTVGSDVVYAVIYGGLTAVRRDNGGLLWRAERSEKESGEDSSFIALNLAVAPVVKEKSLYTAGVRRTKRFQTFVVYCHDADTGRVRWRRELSGEMLQLPFAGWAVGGADDDLNIHTTPGFLCVSGEMLYAVTSGGSVAAIDRRSGEIAWLTLYDRGLDAAPAPLMQDGWAYSPPVAAGGKLVVAPQDSSLLYVFDMKMGKALWSRPRRSEQGNFRYIAAVDPQRGLIFLAGDRLAAYDIETGKARAESAPLQGEAVGAGLIREGQLYIPTTGGIAAADIEASLSGGKIAARQVLAWKEILTPKELEDPDALRRIAGDIVAAEGVLVVTGGSRVTAICDPDKEIVKLGEEIKKGDGDGTQVFRRGLIYASEGDGESALRDLTEAIRKLREKAESREGFEEKAWIHYEGSAPTTLGTWGMRLIQARKSAARLSFEEAARLLGQDPADIKYGELYSAPVERGIDEKAVKRLEISGRNAVDPETYAAGRLILLRRARRLNDWQGYVDILVEMSREWGEAGYDFARYDPDSAVKQISLFCFEAVAEALKAQGAQLYAKYDREAAVLYDAAVAARDMEGLLKAAKTYPNGPNAEKALLSAMLLATREHGAYLAQEYLWRYPEGAARFEVMAARAGSLAELGDADGARSVLTELGSTAEAAGVEEFAPGGGREKVAVYVKNKIASLGRTGPQYAMEMPFEKARISLVAQSEPGNYADTLLLEPEGPAPPGMENSIYLLEIPADRDCAVLTCLDSATLGKIWSAEIPAVTRAAWNQAVREDLAFQRRRIGYSGAGLVLGFGPALMSCDPYNGRTRWSVGAETPEGVLAVTLADRVVYYAAADGRGTVCAVDATSGRTIWQARLNARIAGEMASVNDRLAVSVMRDADQGTTLEMFFLEKSTGRIRGRVQNLKGLPAWLGREMDFRRGQETTLCVKPAGAENVLMLGGDRLAMYRAENGEEIWGKMNAAPAARNAFRLPPPRVLDAGEGICAVITTDFDGINTLDLKNGELLKEFKSPPGWRLSEWFLDGERLEMICAQPCADARYGLNFMQAAFEGKSGELLYRNVFPTGRFICAPVEAKGHVVLVKEDMASLKEGRIEVIIYSAGSGKIIAAPFGLDGVGYSLNVAAAGKGRNLVIKGGSKIATVRIEEWKEK